MNPPVRNPGLNIGFLVGDTSRMLRRIFNERLTHLGMTQAQWRALAHLSRNEGINQVTLSDLLDVQPITVARLIDKLVEAGLVTRRPDPNDRRAQRLFLTDNAQGVLEQIWEVADETYAVVLKGISDTERDTLIDLLARLRTNVGALHPSEAITVTSPLYPFDKNGK
ncbi:MAG: MarR family transcriptional regulator [Parvibaculum sp.]|nr:MarR family transcriptional regulator [Parvibaculum sp.]